MQGYGHLQIFVMPVGLFTCHIHTMFRPIGLPLKQTLVVLFILRITPGVHIRRAFVVQFYLASTFGGHIVSDFRELPYPSMMPRTRILFEKLEKGSRNISLESVASTKAEMTVAFLVGKLSTSTPEVQKQVAHELCLLAKCGMDNRTCIAEAGAISQLMPLLSFEDPKTQENAVTALLNLSIYDNNKVVIVEGANSLDSIIQVLKSGRSVEAKENAAATLFSLSAVNDYKKLIGEMPDAIPALVELLRDGTPRGKRNAVYALFNLSINRSNAARVVEVGAVPLLVNLLTEEDRERPDLADDALVVLAVLSGQRPGLAVVSQTSAIPILVGLLRSASPKGKENAVAVLLSLCRHRGGNVLNAVTMVPSLVPSLYILLKATSLLKILQRWEPPSRKS